MNLVLRAVIGRVLAISIPLTATACVALYWLEPSVGELDLPRYIAMGAIFNFGGLLALVCTLTATTRYSVIGVIGVAVDFLGTMAFMAIFWAGTTKGVGTFSLTDLVAASSSTSDAGSPDASLVLIGILLTLLAAVLPLLNLVLYFGSNRGLAVEITGASTAALIVTWCIAVSWMIASHSFSIDVFRWIATISVLAVAGIAGTPVARVAFGAEPEEGIRANAQRVDGHEVETVAQMGWRTP